MTLALKGLTVLTQKKSVNLLYINCKYAVNVKTLKVYMGKLSIS